MKKEEVFEIEPGIGRKATGIRAPRACEEAHILQQGKERRQIPVNLSRKTGCSIQVIDMNGNEMVKGLVGLIPGRGLLPRRCFRFRVTQ
jgi:hypothetical protein